MQVGSKSKTYSLWMILLVMIGSVMLAVALCINYVINKKIEESINADFSPTGMMPARYIRTDLDSGSNILPEIPERSRTQQLKGTERGCTHSGESILPINRADFDKVIQESVRKLTRGFTADFLPRSYDMFNSVTQPKTFGSIIFTVVNSESSRNNLPPFLDSAAIVHPPLTQSLVVICLDYIACRQCAKLYIQEYCVYMDLGVINATTPASFPFGAEDNGEFRRLTYGKVYAALKIIEQNISVLAVDVDTLFFHNPFSPGEVLNASPDSLAVAVQSKPFDLYRDDDVLIDDGFIYFPATTPAASLSSRIVLERIWDYSCITGVNDHVVITQVLRDVARSMKSQDEELSLLVLPKNKYVSFCNNNCGNTLFETVTSIDELKDMERRITGDIAFSSCEKAMRQNWTFFHTACSSKSYGDPSMVSKYTGLSQRAILTWVLQSHDKNALAFHIGELFRTRGSRKLRRMRD